MQGLVEVILIFTWLAWIPCAIFRFIAFGDNIVIFVRTLHFVTRKGLSWAPVSHDQGNDITFQFSRKLPMRLGGAPAPQSRNIALWPRSEPTVATVVHIPCRQSVTIDALIMDLRSRGFSRGHRNCQYYCWSTILFDFECCHFCTPGDLNRSDRSSTLPICRLAY